MSDAQPLEHFRDWNEEIIRRHDLEVFLHHPHAAVRWVEAKRVKAVVRHLRARPDHVVLDVGCGAGNVLAQLSGPRRYGLDLSPLMLSHAHKRLGQSAALIHGDAEQLPFPNESFDRVVASSLLSHVLHPGQVVAELRRVTRPGGRVVISVSHEDQIERGIRWMKTLGMTKSLLGMGGVERGRAYNVEYHLHRFSLKRLREVVGSQLKETALTKVPTVVFPVHWVVAYERQ
jgi:ubiquinone/menaquinone biosynthesis C-methylase UbiE